MGYILESTTELLNVHWSYVFTIKVLQSFKTRQIYYNVKLLKVQNKTIGTLQKRRKNY